MKKEIISILLVSLVINDAHQGAEHERAGGERDAGPGHTVGRLLAAEMDDPESESHDAEERANDDEAQADGDNAEDHAGNGEAKPGRIVTGGLGWRDWWLLTHKD